MIPDNSKLWLDHEKEYKDLRDRVYRHINKIPVIQCILDNREIFLDEDISKRAQSMDELIKQNVEMLKCIEKVLDKEDLQ